MPVRPQTPEPQSHPTPPAGPPAHEESVGVAKKKAKLQPIVSDGSCYKPQRQACKDVYFNAPPPPPQDPQANKHFRESQLALSRGPFTLMYRHQMELPPAELGEPGGRLLGACIMPQNAGLAVFMANRVNFFDFGQPTQAPYTADGKSILRPVRVKKFKHYQMPMTSFFRSSSGRVTGLIDDVQQLHLFDVHQDGEFITHPKNPLFCATHHGLKFLARDTLLLYQQLSGAIAVQELYYDQDRVTLGPSHSLNDLGPIVAFVASSCSLGERFLLVQVKQSSSSERLQSRIFKRHDKSPNPWVLTGPPGSYAFSWALGHDLDLLTESYDGTLRLKSLSDDKKSLFLTIKGKRRALHTRKSQLVVWRDDLQTLVLVHASFHPKHKEADITELLIPGPDRLRKKPQLFRLTPNVKVTFSGDGSAFSVLDEGRLWVVRDYASGRPKVLAPATSALCDKHPRPYGYDNLFQAPISVRFTHNLSHVLTTQVTKPPTAESNRTTVVRVFGLLSVAMIDYRIWLRTFHPGLIDRLPEPQAGCPAPMPPPVPPSSTPAHHSGPQSLTRQSKARAKPVPPEPANLPLPTDESGSIGRNKIFAVKGLKGFCIRFWYALCSWMGALCTALQSWRSRRADSLWPL